MRITQKEIARRLGISLITVSRALNGTGYVSGSLKERIHTFARENNYVPHKASQVLVRNKVHRIAVFSSSLPAYFWGDIRKGIEVAAQEIRPFNYDVHYYTIPESDSESYMRRLSDEIEKGVSALAFVNQRLYDMKQIFQIAEKHDIPYVTFNVDAPDSNRICYIGSDYQAGGRLAGELIGKTLQFQNNPKVLIITSNERELRFSDAPDINKDRLSGFLSVTGSFFPNVKIDIQYITTKLQNGYVDTQITDLLHSRQGQVSAVYLIAAFNTEFLHALEKLEYSKTITLLHDIDSSAMHHLETHLLSAVIYQNPILQGYYTVKTLEHILETNDRSPLQGVEIVSNLILSENRNFYKNHYTSIS
jgi:LacI family transcriptional regulator